jgi:hypothetical protein
LKFQKKRKTQKRTAKTQRTLRKTETQKRTTGVTENSLEGTEKARTARERFTAEAQRKSQSQVTHSMSSEGRFCSGAFRGDLRGKRWI